MVKFFKDTLVVFPFLSKKKQKNDICVSPHLFFLLSLTCSKLTPLVESMLLDILKQTESRCYTCFNGDQRRKGLKVYAVKEVFNIE